MASTNETVGINRTYKDRLFRLRFGSEEYKEDNYSDMDIMRKLILRFGITLQKAQEYLDKYYEGDKH